MPTFIPGPTYGTQDKTLGHSLTRGFLFSIGFAILIAVSAQIALPLPFTDVPVTLQVFAVLMAGGLLGARWGTLSVVEYLAAGAAGLPVFTQAKGGFLALVGPTGGYLFAFVLAAFCVGWVTDRSKSRADIGAAMLAGVVIIWVCGTLWRHYALQVPASVLLQTSVLPFVAADLLKALAAWALIVRTPRLADRL